MNAKTFSFNVQTQGFSDVHDLTHTVAGFANRANIRDGLVTVFIPGSTAGVTTIEYEPGVVDDLKKAIERIAPTTIHYDHDARWGDGNGFAHVRASLLGPSLAIPLVDGTLALGTWQQIVLVDFDNRPRNRTVVVQILGQA
jgi:secondary thiamine-phosphate synthase enzyme